MKKLNILSLIIDANIYFRITQFLEGWPYIRALIIDGTGNISASITKYFVERGSDKLILFNRGNLEVKGAKTIKVDRTDYAVFEEKAKAIGKLDVVIDSDKETKIKVKHRFQERQDN